MRQLLLLYKKCKKSDSNFIFVLWKYLIYKIAYRKIILKHQKVEIRGVKNIKSKYRLEVGIAYVGFSHKKDRTYLNIKGKLILNSNYSIGRGCRFDIGKDAIVSIGKGGYINCNTKFVIMHNLKIGDNCVISWDCQFLDEDFHKINYDGKKVSNNSIIIGNNVWVGCGAQIYKGTVIPDGCVVASNSVVRGIFTEKNTIIGGNPAKIIKKNIEWN